MLHRWALGTIARATEAWLRPRIQPFQREVAWPALGWSFHSNLYAPPPDAWSRGRRATELGAELGRRAPLMRVAWLVGQPTESEVLAIATALLPIPYPPGAQLLRDAITLAWSTDPAQRRAAKARAEQSAAPAPSLLGTLTLL